MYVYVLRHVCIGNLRSSAVYLHLPTHWPHRNGAHGGPVCRNQTQAPKQSRGRGPLFACIWGAEDGDGGAARERMDGPVKSKAVGRARMFRRLEALWDLRPACLWFHS